MTLYDRFLATVPRMKFSVRGWRREWVYIVLATAPIVIVFGGLYLGSLFRLVLLSFNGPDFSIANYLALFANASLMSTLGYTVVLAAGIAAISVLLSYPVALVMLYASPGLRNLLTFVIVIPMWVSTLVRSYAWMVLLGRRGIINEALFSIDAIDEPLTLLYTRFAVIVGLVNVMLPFTVFPIYSAMKRIDQRLLVASRSLGATPLTTFACVFLPLTLPGAAAGAVLVFVLAVAYWVTPMLLGGLSDTTFVMLIEQQVHTVGNWNFAAAMSITVLVLTLTILFVFQRLIGFSFVSRDSEIAVHNSRLLRAFSLVAPWLNRISAYSARFFASGHANVEVAPRLGFARLVTVLVVIFIVGPILVLLPVSFSATPYLQFPPTQFSLKWYGEYLTADQWVSATFVSLRVACATAALSVVIGTMSALVLTKVEFVGRGALLALFMSPMVVPNIVIAVAFYFQFAQFGIVGTQMGLVLAHLILTIPFVLMVVMAGLKTLDPNLELAAQSLGAGPSARFRTVVLPLLLPSILSATFFAFIISFDEVVVAAFLSGTTEATLPKVMLNATRFEFRPTIAAVSVILVALTFAVVLSAGLIQRYVRRRRGLQDAPSFV